MILFLEPKRPKKKSVQCSETKNNLFLRLSFTWKASWVSE